MSIKEKLNTLLIYAESEAIISQKGVLTYNELFNLINHYSIWLEEMNVLSGSAIMLNADYNSASIALLLALLKNNCIVSLNSTDVPTQNETLQAIVKPAYYISVDKNEHVNLLELSFFQDNSLISNLKKKQEAGVIIFTSGSTGVSKACVHNANVLFSLINTQKKAYRTISFLLFDHIGGLNCLFNCLFNGGTLVLPNSRMPIDIAKSIQCYKVQALVTTPSFLNMLLLSGVSNNYDLASLETINYGAEPMSLTTLKQLKNLLPEVKFNQSYGMSELGVIPTRSKSSDSLLVKLGNDNCKIRVVNGMLQIKSLTSMLGYLNYKCPMTEDGWFDTGDAVVEDGEYYRIIGRKSECINIGGEKSYPVQIEGVLQEINDVIDVVVYGEKHPFLGSIVCAKFTLSSQENGATFRSKVRAFCKGKLPAYQIPQKIIVTNNVLYNRRYKKIRSLHVS